MKKLIKKIINRKALRSLRNVMARMEAQEHNAGENWKDYVIPTWDLAKDLIAGEIEKLEA